MVPPPYVKVSSVEIGILGGTGPEGRGLAVRWAAAGHRVVLGSRDAGRARDIASNLVAAWPGRRLAIEGRENAGAAEAETVVVATPWDGAVPTVRPLGEALAGKIVLSVAVAMVKQGRELLAVQLPRGSVAASLQAALPGSLVAAAGHHLPAADLENLDNELHADVLVCSDHTEASMLAVGLMESIAGLRPLEAGSLAQAAAIEAFTAVCVTVNLRYRVHTSVRLEGI